MSDLERSQPDLFRRRRFEAPHRRRHPLRRLLKPFAAAVAVVGIPAAAAAWVATSPEFEIRRIDVVATPRVPAEWVGERLQGLAGRHLLAIRLAEVERRLAEHPWIAGLVLRRQLPGRLEVKVVERLPAALWSGDGGLMILDRAGEPIAPLAADSGPLDLPVVSAATPHAAVAPASAARAAAIHLAGRWERLRPGERVSQVEILRPGDFRLVTSELPFTLVVSAGRLEAAAAALDRARPLLEQSRLPPTLPLAAVGSVDLRFSRQIVFQPAAPPPREEG